MAPKTPPQPKPKKPVDVDIEYFFCSNVNCNYHASFIVGRRPPDANFVVGGTCPQCGVGKIDVLRFRQKEDVPLASTPVNARALPAPPYGGKLLRLGDRDDQLIYGGEPDPEAAKNTGAHFVAELQRDLLRLAFYGPARGGETVGVFSQMLHGGVLDLKRHLVLFYGVDALEDLEEVQKRALAADAERAARAAARAQKRLAAGVPGGDTPEDEAAERALEEQQNAPICYIKTGLAGPQDVYAFVKPWSDSLGDPNRPGVPVLLRQTFEKFVARWVRSKQSGLPDDAQGIAAIQTQVGVTEAARDQLKADLVAANAGQRALAARIASERNKKAKLTEDEISATEQAMEALIAELNRIGDGLPATLAAVKQLDQSLPGSSNAATEPPSTPITLTATTPADDTSAARFDRVVADDTTARQVLTTQGNLSTFIDRKVSTSKSDQKKLKRSFRGRASLIETELFERNELEGLTKATIEKLRDDMRAAASAAKLLNDQPPEGKPTQAFVFLRQSAIRVSSFWVQVAGPPPPGSQKPVGAGTLPALQARIAELEATFAAATPPIPLPEEWGNIKAGVNTLLANATAYRDQIQRSDATTLMGSYVKLLRRFGIVDGATARYIRRMVMDGRLGNRPVFRTPMGPEIIPFSLAQDLASVFDEAVKERPALKLKDMPKPIMVFICTHESGGVQTKPFRDLKNATVGDPSREWVQLGIDWKTPGNPAFFEEQKTLGQQLSSSRGWGIGQKTFFTEVVQVKVTLGLDKNPPALAESANAVPVTMRSGIPYATAGASTVPIPFALTSGRAGAKSGALALLDAFSVTQLKRECSFKDRHECSKCVKNLTTGDFQRDDKGRIVRRGGMAFFKEEEGNFARVIVNGELVSHRFSTLEAMKDLVSRDLYRAVRPGSTASVPAADLNESDTLEFPCSWLSAITRYAGKGQNAWYYPLNGIFFLQNNKLP
jgi:hypothetical protein